MIDMDSLIPAHSTKDYKCPLQCHHATEYNFYYGFWVPIDSCLYVRHVTDSAVPLPPKEHFITSAGEI